MSSHLQVFVFVFLFRHLRTLKEEILYETCCSKFFDVQLVLGRVNAIRASSNLLTRVLSLPVLFTIAYLLLANIILQC